MVCMSAQRTLGIFAKRPRAGQVKTRLATETTPEWAAAVAAALLRDTLARLADFDGRRVMAFAPADARADFEPLAGAAFALVPQGEGDLGARMAMFIDAQLAGGGPVVLMGADSPTLPPQFVEDAFAALDS